MYYLIAKQDKKPSGNFSSDVNVYQGTLCNEQQPIIIKISIISVPKNIYFVITNFITFILDNLWETNSFNGAISAAKPKKYEGKKNVGKTKCPHQSACFFSPSTNDLLILHRNLFSYTRAKDL